MTTMREPRRARNCWSNSASRATGSRRWAACSAGCARPVARWAHAMEFPPRKLILQAAAGNLDKLLASPSLWMCVACYTCSKRCPRGIELTDGLWPALRDAAMQQGFQPPAELQETFQNIFKYGNMLGKSPRQRLDWAKDLDVRVLDLSKESRPVDVLWLVGCYPSYYPRNQVVARAFARILTELGRHLGRARDARRRRSASAIGCSARKGCSRRSSRRTASSSTSRISTSSWCSIRTPTGPCRTSTPASAPGIRCSTTPCSWPSAWSNCRPLMVKPVEAMVTYHDNCCVGRRCGCYDPPRALLELIPGVKLVEMARNRDNALCCGGGGGGMWLDAHIVAQGGQRLSDQRVAPGRRDRRRHAGRLLPLRVVAVRGRRQGRRAWKGGSRSATSSNCWPNRMDLGERSIA